MNKEQTAAVDGWRCETERAAAAKGPHSCRLRANVSDACVDFFHSSAGQYFLLLLMKDAKYKLCAELNKKEKIIAI